jgi:hypothetical protein
MKKYFYLLLLLIISSTTFAQVQPIASFSNLDSLFIEYYNTDYSIYDRDKDTFVQDHIREQYVGYLKFDPSTTTICNIPSDIEEDAVYGAVSIEKIIKTKIGNNKSFYYVTYGGMEGFLRGFSIWETLIPPKIIGQIHAHTLIIPGNGSVYAINRDFENFDVKRKYTFVKGNLVEEQQPLYSINLTSYALHPITIYADSALTKKLAVIPQYGKIEVIAAINPKSYPFLCLVRTSFGLIGWTTLAADQYMSVDVKGLYYSGS